MRQVHYRGVGLAEGAARVALPVPRRREARLELDGTPERGGRARVVLRLEEALALGHGRARGRGPPAIAKEEATSPEDDESR